MAEAQTTPAKHGLGSTRTDQPRRRLSIALTLLLSFGSLIAISILTVLGLAVWTAGQNTFDLLRDRADLGIDRLIKLAESKLKPAEEKSRFIARAIADGRVDPADRVRFGATLLGVMSSGRAIGAVVLINPKRELYGARRQRGGKIDFYTASLEASQTMVQAIEWARKSRTPRWVAPIWVNTLKFAILSRHTPIWRKGKFLGILVVAVRIDDMSRELGRSEGSGGRVFITYGKKHILAHPFMERGYPGQSARAPLPLLAGFGDPVLRLMWDNNKTVRALFQPRPPLKAHVVRAVAGDYVFIYRELRDYTETPWYVGVYFRGDVFSREILRLRNALFAGGAALLLAIIVAFFIGRQLSKPIARLSISARKIRELKFNDVGILPHSRVRELDDQSNTFNSMVGALRWFQAYVPKPLVQQLMRDGDLAALESDKRNLTVMFTDIAGYSTISEGKGAAEIAELLNQHFTIVAGAVEAEGGTVDKFIGDSVMAFWGAPEKQKNRAIRACRAALSIRDDIAADNLARAARGEPPVRMRIGIHSGEATVGNIGPPDRVNYTVIGDDVNVAQRLEQLGKQVSPDDEVSILVSAATVTDLEELFETAPAGELAVKGREAPVEVFQLSDGPRTAESEPLTSAA